MEIHPRCQVLSMKILVVVLRNSPVVLYLNNSPQGGSKTFYSDRVGADGLDHALVIGPVNGVYSGRI